MKKIFYIILISILFAPNSYSKNLSGFVIENENNKFNLQPISKSYKGMIKNLIDNFEEHIDPNDPTNNCLDVAIISAPEKRTQKTVDKLQTIAGRVLKK